MEDFKEFLYENIKGSGVKWTIAARRLKVPYDTLMKWKNGTVNPPEYIKELVKKEIEGWQGVKDKYTKDELLEKINELF